MQMKTRDGASINVSENISLKGRKHTAPFYTSSFSHQPASANELLRIIAKEEQCCDLVNEAQVELFPPDKISLSLDNELYWDKGIKNIYKYGPYGLPYIPIESHPTIYAD